MSETYTYAPDYAIHPGETLAETLEALGMSQKDLAERTGRPLKTINEIIKGKAAVTAETAIQLQRVTGVPASFWNNAQRNYEAALAAEAEEAALERDLKWLKDFPVRELVKLEWIPKVSDPVDQLRAVLDYFGVAGVQEWKSLWTTPQAAFRESKAFRANPMAVAAWLREGERQAQEIQTRPFAKSRFLDALAEIRCLTREDCEVFEPKMIDLCADSGVAVVFVPPVPGTRAFGATRWLSSKKAIVQLSLRGKTDDLLWFTFFHEAGHILKHGKKDFFIESDNRSKTKEIEEKENEANTFAADFLIPPKDYRKFTESEDFSEHSVASFARKLGIAPGIVVGRLQREKHITYKQCHRLKRPIDFA